MDYIVEPSKSYDSLDTLRQDLALMDVRESQPFQLNQMRLTTQGTVQITGLGEFPLTEIALGDAVRYGGLQMSCCQNFFEEHKEVLDESITQAVNAYYQNSQAASSEVKLITRAGEKGRITLGIPSRKYALFSHERAVEMVVKNSPPGLNMARCHVHPQFMEIALVDPLHVVKDRIGKVVSIGLNFLNSQGTRTCALSACCFSFRVICTNGATANCKNFSRRYPHRGDLGNNNYRFASETREIFDRFSLMMQQLPKLGDIPISDKLLSQIKPDLVEAIAIKETDKFLQAIDTARETVTDLWNKVTELPHHIQNPETKLRLEQLGFRLLTMHLNAN
jgi:hypothetical protein